MKRNKQTTNREKAGKMYGGEGGGGTTQHLISEVTTSEVNNKHTHNTFETPA